MKNKQTNKQTNKQANKQSNAYRLQAVLNYFENQNVITLII